MSLQHRIDRALKLYRMRPAPARDNVREVLAVARLAVATGAMDPELFDYLFEGEAPELSDEDRQLVEHASAAPSGLWVALGKVYRDRWPGISTDISRS